MSAQKNPEVIVVGGCFAGLNVVKGLESAQDLVTLGSKYNYHLFQLSDVICIYGVAGT